MNTPNQPSAWKRTTTARIIRWLFSWRIFRRLLIVLAWTVTIIALFYGEENWRGRRAWNRYRTELEASGEQLDYTAFIPGGVPDDQNFAAIPFVRSWFSEGNDLDKIWDKTFWTAETSLSDSKFRNDRGIRHFHDLAAHQMAFEAIRSKKTNRFHTFESDQLDLKSRAKVAPDVLEELKIDDAKFAELRSASRRSYSRYPVVYDLENLWGIQLPHLPNIKRATQILKIKACAELAAGRGQAALEDVKLMLYLADSVKDEPLLISYLVRMACVQITASAVWEGLAERVWSEAQLEELQTRFQQYDFIAGTKKPLAAERAAGVLTVDLLLKRKYHFGELFTINIPLPEWIENLGAVFGLDRVPPANIIAQIIPRGWYHQEQLNYCRIFHAGLEEKFDAANRRVITSPIESGVAEMNPEVSLPSGSAPNGRGFRRGLRNVIRHRLLARLLLFDLRDVQRRTATTQIIADQAALACGLERYHLANKQFPENLEALVPRFISKLPHDVLTGEPYKYKRTDDGQFVLYSVGWNGKDDGGVPGKQWFDETQGDWVWSYPSR